MVRINKTERQLIILALIGVIIAAGSFFVLAYENYCCGPSLCVSCMTLSPGHEALNVDSYQFNSSTNLTMNIRNTGPNTISLTAYRVQDANQNGYTSFGWSGPTIPLNTVVSVNVVIDGRVLTFQPQTSYMVEVLTSRNGQFGFTVTTS